MPDFLNWFATAYDPLETHWSKIRSVLWTPSYYQTWRSRMDDVSRLGSRITSNAASDKVIEWASVNAVTTLTMLPKAGAASGTASHRFSRRSNTAGSNSDNRNSR